MKFEFANEENKTIFCKKVLTWLKNDFEQKGKPSPHFWHNRGPISSSFDSCCGMVVLDDKDGLMAYMVWSPADTDPVVSIDIAEVVEKYQNQGIFKRMISEFSSKYTHAYVLEGFIIQQSIEKFRHLGWEDGRIENWEDLHLLREARNQDKRIGYFFKKIRESLPALDELPAYV